MHSIASAETCLPYAFRLPQLLRRTSFRLLVGLPIESLSSVDSDAAEPHNCRSECGEASTDPIDVRTHNNNRTVLRAF